MELVLRRNCVKKNNTISAQTEYKYAPKQLGTKVARPRTGAPCDKDSSRVTNRKNWVHSTHCKRVLPTLVETAVLTDHREILTTEKGRAISPDESAEFFPDHTISGVSRYNLRPRKDPVVLEKTG
ncbi:hypothetical protein NDU88_002615 [Pleurodeles waltl]|uniref:Uncharacterized protein n=1 Tax=Pleurodeles waltl TaxID=8319 RepID=A0AAV7P8S4_PLEWA|nr:hypothetical protein NDU88_002615 [Pleurodeles waltl]